MNDKLSYALAIIIPFTVVGALVKFNSLISYHNEKPKFAVGDCLEDMPDPKLEHWEVAQQDRFYKVREIGKRSYRLDVIFYNHNDFSIESTKLFWLYDDTSHKIECPKGWE